jgi:tetratricopeptide (TPR) repeat protein
MSSTDGGRLEAVDRIGTQERDWPLRRRILEALSSGVTAPSELADHLGVRRESVSRLLTPLQEEGLVSFESREDDRRKRAFELTVAGEVALSRHRGYGTPQRAPHDPNREERVAFQYSALYSAVEMRRKTNDLAAAAERIGVVLRQARKLEEEMLVIEALSELATTLLQLRASEKEIQTLLAELQEISLGRGRRPDASVVLPAAAHRRYALGRLGEAGESVERRAELLLSATNDYAELAVDPPHLDSDRWAEHQGWGLVNLGRNLQARSLFEDALERAAEARGLFERIDNPYGVAHGLLLSGHCLVLMGDFEQAWAWLNEAHELGRENSFERFEAEALLQLGEALRCRRQHGDAREALEEARERAMRMNLKVVEAFAHSALGAVAFHTTDYDEALRELRQATVHFERLEHIEGLALTSRRQAALARRFAAHEEAAREIAKSNAYYRRFGSPAGVVACQIESGRLRLTEGRDATVAVAGLLNLIDNQPTRRTLVELDPWVPRVLARFAEETDDGPFIRRCQDLLAAADEKLGGVARRAVEAVGPRATEEVRPAKRKADEMGGESRQALESALEPVAA